MLHAHNHSFTHSLTHSFTHSLTHSFTYSLTYSLTHSLTHSLTLSLTHSLTHSFTHSLIHSLTHSVLLLHAHAFQCTISNQTPKTGITLSGSGWKKKGIHICASVCLITVFQFRADKRNILLEPSLKVLCIKFGWGVTLQNQRIDINAEKENGCLTWQKLIISASTKLRKPWLTYMSKSTSNFRL